MREVFILQFDISGEPNETECTAIKLDGRSIEFKSIPSVTASDIYEAISRKKIWPSKAHTDVEVSPEKIEEINDILRERKENE